MSLTTEQQARTRDELVANLHLTGLTDQQIQTDLDFTAQQLDDTLHLRSGSHPADVWLLRDYLDQHLHAQGKEPVPFTVLTKTARLAASLWFTLRRAPQTRLRS
jgi:hypothetical protein